MPLARRVDRLQTPLPQRAPRRLLLIRQLRPACAPRDARHLGSDRRRRRCRRRLTLHHRPAPARAVLPLCRRAAGPARARHLWRRREMRKVWRYDRRTGWRGARRAEGRERCRWPRAGAGRGRDRRGIWDPADVHDACAFARLLECPWP